MSDCPADEARLVVTAPGDPPFEFPQHERGKKTARGDPNCDGTQDRPQQYRRWMPRWSLIVLLAVAVICAGVGTSLTAAFDPSSAAGFGWTAYAPLSKTVYSGSYAPINTTWLIWAPRLGVALLALGAGTAGAAIVALLLRRPRRSNAAPHPE